MLKDIKIVAYGALPCEAKEFEINGKNADKSDFGYNTDKGVWDYDFDENADENWSCCDNQFVKVESSQEVLDKYGISQAEFEEIQEKLADKFSVGGCGWCV